MADSYTGVGASELEPKKQRLPRRKANALYKRKTYYKCEENQQKLRERIEVLYQSKADIEQKIADLEKFLRTDSPGTE